MHPPAEEHPRPDNNGPYPIQLQQYERLLRRFCASPITMGCLASVALFLTVSVVCIFIERVHAKLAAIPPLELASPPWTFWRERAMENGMPRILLWHRTAMPSADTKDRGPSSNVINCPTSAVAGQWLVTCEVTDDRSWLESSDAVVFQAERVSPEDMPSRRTGFQNWVLWTRKHVCPVGGPATSRNDSRLTFATCGRSHPQVRTEFDWSMGRREDSDIKTSYKSWRCGEVDDASGSTKMADVARRNYDALGYYGDRRDAAWIVDSCDWQLCRLSSISAVQLDAATRATTGRQEQNVSVDLIPDCGRSMCGSRRECLRKIAAHYRFVIVSTDTDCFHSPYELIYDAFEFDVVPVLLASPREAVRVPSFSVVYSAQFHGLGDLASHLRMLATNREAYEQYFLWKESCSHVPENLDDDVCPLCIALNHQMYNGSTRSSAGFWSWMPGKRARPCDACTRRMPGFHWAFSPIFRSYRDWQ